MDSDGLQNSSKYVNNLLLARGLLRNGTSIEFATPKRAPGGTEETMSQIINLVHDLIVRRDRDAEQRESLGNTIRNLRAEETRKVVESERLQNKNAELLRNRASLESHQRFLETSARNAEASVRELKDQMAKMKSTLDQVRAKCVNDIRKRDIELEKLKKHFTGMQRGAIHSGGMKILQLNPPPPLPSGAREFGLDLSTNDENWSLEKESNGFLAEVVNETSTENTALRRIVSEAIDTLKELTELSEPTEKIPFDPEIGMPGQYKQSRQNAQFVQQAPLVSCKDLSMQLEVVLDHCRAILKDPSFVSIDEIQIREEEILRLREGWERMAERWKDAMAMMDAWRRRMLERGNAVDLGELGTLAFTKSLATKSDAEAAAGHRDELPTAPVDDIPERLNEWTGVCDEKENGHVRISLDDESLHPSPRKRLTLSPARRGICLKRRISAVS